MYFNNFEQLARAQK